MPRPDLNEDIVSEIRRIHSETHKEEASSFQEALDTVVQLAKQAQSTKSRETGEPEGWYPGKYAGKVINSVVGDDDTNSQSSATTPRLSPETEGINLSSQAAEETAIFKTRLGEDRTITVPEPEAAALGLETEALLQVYARKIDTTESGQ